MSEMEFRETVRLLMARRRETHDVIAEVIGVQRPGVTNRLSGRSRWTLDEVHLLARHWGCEPGDLLMGPLVALERTEKRETPISEAR